MAVYGIGENKCLKEVLKKTEVYAKSDFIYIDKIFTIAADKQGVYTLTADEIGVESLWDIVPISHMLSWDGSNFYPADSSYTTTTYKNQIRIDTDDDKVMIYYGHGNEFKGYMYVKVVLMKVK